MKLDPRRGDPWEFDAGPPAAVAQLFAETPNYRGLGLAVTGREAFRWHFGPMFYRGRWDGSARVLVIGQEGAQDESLSHRSFTGGTGARMQHFLRHLGIDHSYLFLNSFVYPIFGQYTPTLRPLAQDPRSPIVAHRHRILDQVLAGGELRLVIAVGRAAKETVETWVQAHGGAADADHLDTATNHQLGANIRLLGVLHPGGAGKGGSVAAIRADFQRAAQQVGTWLQADAGWLPTDPGMTRDLTKAFTYSAAPIPHRDFPFGMTPRLGRGGTSSNRADNQRSIRLFSAAGKYGAKGARLSDPSSATGSNEGYADDPGDLPYEPPRGHPTHHDPGPPVAMARMLAGAAAGLAWPDFAALGVTAHPSLGTGPIYRGRFTNASLYVIADPDAADDLFTGRAQTGEGGQRLQAFLAAAGLTSRYLIVSTAPVNLGDIPTAKRQALGNDPDVAALHREIFARVRTANPNIAAIVTIGPGAAAVAGHLGATIPVIPMAAWGTVGQASSWAAALGQLQGLAYPKDVATATFTMPSTRSQIPRIDLPYGSPRWYGTSGDRGVRATDTTIHAPSPDYFKVFLPAWVDRLDARPLTAADQAIAELLT